MNNRAFGTNVLLNNGKYLDSLVSLKRNSIVISCRKHKDDTRIEKFVKQADPHTLKLAAHKEILLEYAALISLASESGRLSEDELMMLGFDNVPC